MCSIITTEPSTIMPMAMASPPRDMRLADTPQWAMAMRARPMDMGTEMSTRKVARRLSRNSMSTTTMSTKASSRALATVCTAWSTSSAWS